MELHALAWLDKGRITHPEIVSYEVWYRTVDTDTSNGPSSWQAYPAAEWSDTAAAGTAVFSRCAHKTHAIPA